MALFVYVTKQCQQDATKHQLKSELQELVARIEQQQALWSLDAFLHPFWVKKRLGNRHTRLICRIESHTVGGEVHDVLVMMSIMQRSPALSPFCRQNHIFKLGKEGVHCLVLVDRLHCGNVLLRQCQKRLVIEDRKSVV